MAVLRCEAGLMHRAHLGQASKPECSATLIVCVCAAESSWAWLECGCSWLTYPTEPDAQLCLRQHGEVKPLGAGLNVKRLLFAPQRTKQPPGPAGEKIHDGELSAPRHRKQCRNARSSLPLIPSVLLIQVTHEGLWSVEIKTLYRYTQSTFPLSQAINP